MRDIAIVAGVRTPFGRAVKGVLKDTRPEDFTAPLVQELLKRVPQVAPAEIEDLILGCAMPEGEQGLNIARIIGLMGGLPVEVPAMTVNRFCSSGLQAIAIAAGRLMAEEIAVAMAGGVESMSMVPMGGNKMTVNPSLADRWPEVYVPMGITAESVARRFEVSRSQQDQFALQSHQKAVAAQQSGAFGAEIVPVVIEGRKGAVTVDKDEPPRADTTLEALGKLKAAFVKDGTVTAGNAPGLNDGASATVVTSLAFAQAHGLTPLARINAYATGGGEPKDLFFAPIVAVQQLMKKEGKAIGDYDLVEANEAFAVQALADGRGLGWDWDRVNVNGGAVALGHPIGASGARVLTTLLYAMQARDKATGLATLCLGGGNAVALSVERI